MRKYLSENAIMNCGFESKEHCKTERRVRIWGDDAERLYAFQRKDYLEFFSAQDAAKNQSGLNWCAMKERA